MYRYIMFKQLSKWRFYHFPVRLTSTIAIIPSHQCTPLLILTNFVTPSASDEWNNLEEETREEMGLTKDHDGEFWMSLEDFQACWSKLEVLRANNKFTFFPPLTFSSK